MAFSSFLLHTSTTALMSSSLSTFPLVFFYTIMHWPMPNPLTIALSWGREFGFHYSGSLKAIVNLKVEFQTSMNGLSIYLGGRIKSSNGFHLKTSPYLWTERERKAEGQMDSQVSLYQEQAWSHWSFIKCLATYSVIQIKDMIIHIHCENWIQFYYNTTKMTKYYILIIEVTSSYFGYMACPWLHTYDNITKLLPK